jgi:hypothetical protein
VQVDDRRGQAGGGAGRAIASITTGSPPLWSQCQCDRNTVSIVARSIDQPLGVGQPHVAVGADVEQHGGAGRRRRGR